MAKIKIKFVTREPNESSSGHSVRTERIVGEIAPQLDVSHRIHVRTVLKTDILNGPETGVLCKRVCQRDAVHFVNDGRV